MVGVHGWITAAPGALLIALLDHYSAPFPTRTETTHDGTTVTITDTRTAGQRRADAFTRILYDAAAGTLPLTPTTSPDFAAAEPDPDPAGDEPGPDGDETEPADLVADESSPAVDEADLVGDDPFDRASAASASSGPHATTGGEPLVPDRKTRGGEPPRIVITATLAQVLDAFAQARATTGSDTDPASGPGSDTASGLDSSAEAEAWKSETEAWDTRRDAQPRGLGPSRLSGLSGSAECDQLGPIPPWLLARLTCDAVLERVLLADNGAVLALGRAVRTATPAQRRALAARDGGCAGPGCLIPAKWCDVHHVTPWALGGVTDVDQMVLLCPREHDLVHQGILEVRMVDGVPWVRPPHWLDPLRRWTRNTYWTQARHHADHTGRQLRLALDPPLPDQRHPPDQHQPPDAQSGTAQPENRDPPEAAA